MTVRSKITAKGQTTIPVEIRELLDLKPGDILTYDISGKRAHIEKARSALELAGVLHDPKRKPLTIDEMKSAWAESALERYEQSLDRN
jgi:antitoxin PrlF